MMRSFELRLKPNAEQRKALEYILADSRSAVTTTPH
jgi:hypothetical protein